MSKELIGIFEVGDNSEGLCGCGCGEDLSNYNTYAGKILSHNTEKEIDEWADKLAGSIFDSIEPKIGLMVRCTGEEFGCGGWYNVCVQGDCVSPDSTFILDPFWIKVEELATSGKKGRRKARKIMKDRGVEYVN